MFIHCTMSHVTRKSYIQCATYINSVCNIHLCVQHTFMCATYIRTTHLTRVWHDSFICVTWLIQNMHHDSFICLTRLIHTCRSSGWVTSHICMRHVTNMNVSWHTYKCVMSHIWMRHGPHMNASSHTYECVMSHIWLRHLIHMNASCHTYEFVTLQIWIFFL